MMRRKLCNSVPDALRPELDTMHENRPCWKIRLCAELVFCRNVELHHTEPADCPGIVPLYKPLELSVMEI